VANTLLTIDKVTNEAVRVLHSNTAFLKGVNKEYDDQFAQPAQRSVTRFAFASPRSSPCETVA
jgi:hypothetical protein